MARSRQIKPDFFLNEDLSALDPLTRLLFQGLWVLADREGRLEDRPAKIKAQIFPYHDANVDEMLDALSNGFICRYQADGRQFIEVLNFKKHQHIHPDEKISVIPKNQGIPGDYKRSRGIMPCSSSSSSSSSSSPKQIAPSPSDSEPPVLIFPCVGSGSKEWGLTKSKVAEWTKAYPGINIEAEARKALQWCRDNPSKQKTARGMTSFLGRWMDRATDQGRRGVYASIQDKAKNSAVSTWESAHAYLAKRDKEELNVQ